MRADAEPGRDARAIAAAIFGRHRSVESAMRRHGPAGPSNRPLTYLNPDILGADFEMPAAEQDLAPFLDSR